MDITKSCKMCKVNKPITAYYKNKHSGYYHSNCLQCVNMQRSSYKTNGNYIPKPTGLAKYSIEDQNYVRESMKNGVEIKQISEVSGINKSTLLFWHKKGLI